MQHNGLIELLVTHALGFAVKLIKASKADVLQGYAQGYGKHKKRSRV